MSTQDNSTDNTLTGDAQLTSADGGAAVAPGTMTLSEMNALLGKDFKDTDSALKAIKDTFGYVGKKKEDIEAEVRATLSPNNAPDNSKATESALAQMRKELFYATNPQFKGYEDLIASMGDDPAEVVKSGTFNKVFDKVKVADEAEQKRSVVSSSSRLAETKTAYDEAITVANARGAGSEQVATVLARAIQNEIAAG